MNRRTFCAILPATGALRSVDAATPGQTPRERLLFDHDWKFLLGDPAGAEASSFDAGGWRTVNAPHDWSIELPMAANAPSGRGGGYFPGGVGWYRRAFAVPASWNGKRVSVEFEGVYMNATVYINGEELGMHPYGYTSFFHDLTPHLKPGANNVLAVRVDNSKQRNSRWYSGSGIYRHVWLNITDAVHVAPWGVFITTPEVNAARAKVSVKIRVMNESAGSSKITLRTVVYAGSGAAAGQTVAATGLEPGGSIVATQEIAVEKPALWSPETPNLYRAVTRVVQDGKTVDEVTTPFGIRSLEWSAEKGFLLNGNSIKMNGGCVHHDHGPLGAASFDRAEERRVQTLKDAGLNAIRTAHNPPSPAFLSACDRLGMLVIDEAFDCWSRGKNQFDYGVAFKEWWQRDISSMVLRDGNHPSVVMWSIGNEVQERGDPLGAQEAKMLADYVRGLDRSRPVTSSVNSFNGNWANADEYFAALDICGYNYNLRNHVSALDVGAPNDDKCNHVQDHKRVPSRIMACTESFPQATFDDWATVTDFPYIIGNFVWTAVDYLGESGLGRWSFQDANATGRAGPGNSFPCHGANSGDVDICGNLTVTAHYRNIVWDRGEKIYLGVHPPVPEGKTLNVTQWGVAPVFQNWTWPGMEGKQLDVDVYSRSEAVRLFLGDKLIGEKPTTRAERFKATFSVPYAPGTLRAVAVQGGKPVAEAFLKTVGEPLQIRLTADRTSVRADGQGLSFITVEAVDANGQANPNAGHQVTFSLRGPGTIAAVGNADLESEEPYQGNRRKLLRGKALVVVRSSRTAGTLVLTGSAPGLKDGVVQIASRS